MTRTWLSTYPVLAAVIIGLGFVPMIARGQTSSMIRGVNSQSPLTLRDTSWTYVEIEPPPEILLNSVITVVVQENARITSEGEMDRRKQASLDAVLSNWLSLEGLSLKPATQATGEPQATGSINSRYRAEGELETSDSMNFTITTRVVDIRPNGNLVIEGHKSIRNNNEIWEQSLTGIVRPEDVNPNNEVLSKHVSELQIYKRERGHVRDGYRRGWLLRMIDQYKPF